MAGSDASIVLGALPVGLQLWESAGRDPARPVLAWSNREGDRETGAEAARAALAGDAVDAIRACDAGLCRVRARPLGDGRVVVSFEDVTELAASERLNAAIVAGLEQALIVIDTRGRVTRANEAAAALCGVSLGELVGSQARDLPVSVSGRDGRAIEAQETPIYRALGGETVHRALVQIERADGSAQWVEVASCPLHEPGAAFAAPLELGDVREALRAAVGVARYPVDGGDLDDLLTAADRDMYTHKGSDPS